MPLANAKDIASIFVKYADDEDRKAQELKELFAGQPIPPEIEKGIRWADGAARMWRMSAQELLRGTEQRDDSTSQSSESSAAPSPGPQVSK
jgi:hypothetical protein